VKSTFLVIVAEAIFTAIIYFMGAPREISSFRLRTTIIKYQAEVVGGRRGDGSLCSSVTADAKIADRTRARAITSFQFLVK